MISQRGVVLVQVMVLSMVLGTIAAMLVQWQFSRYVTTYRVENFARSRAILQAAFNKKISDMIPVGSAGTWGAVTITDPVFGNCTITFDTGCNWDANVGTDLCASFDPCACTGSPCS